MSSYIDLKFINILSSRLNAFKKKGDYLFNFRCPYCGDSQKDKNKARGYLYRVKNDMFYKCHNCGVGTNLANFIKEVDIKLHKEYILERFKKQPKDKEENQFDFKPFKSEDENILDGCTKIIDLKEDHPARVYVANRKIPAEHFKLLHLCGKWMTLVNKVKPNTYKNITKDYPRLVIPFYDELGELFAFQGRAFGKEEPRYMTIKLDEDRQKVYGLERVNFLEPIKVVEGPLDSLFLNNCLAAAGADLTFLKKGLSTLDKVMAKGQITYIYDNEPRNHEIIKRMYKVIDEDYNIVIWPEDIKEKDINDMVKSNIDVEQIIKDSTYNGLSAKTTLKYWKKVY